MSNNFKNTSWTAGDVTVTLDSILTYLKDTAVYYIDVDSISHMCIHVGKNDDETKKRSETADLTYPIVIASHNDSYVMILDGHHRLLKCINNNIPTIKAKILNLNEYPDVLAIECLVGKKMAMEINKKHQKQILIEMMQQDEKDGLYNIPNSKEAFNQKYKDYLEPRFYGLEIGDPDVIYYLDQEFEKEIKQNPTFQYSQIKLKFGRTVIYCNKELDAVRKWEEKIDGILLVNKP